MRKNWSIRSVTLLALTLALPWAAHGESGKLYRYTSSRPDGSGVGDELLFVSGSRVEIFSKQRSDSVGTLLVFEMGGPGLAPRALKVWGLAADGRVFMGTIESLPSGKDIRVEIIPSGRPAETVAVPVYPWVMFNGVPALSLAFAALEEPQGSFTVGLMSPSDGPNEPAIRFSGAIKLSYAGDEERGGVPTRKYRLEGEGASGFAWAHRDEKRLEAWETARTRIQLAGVETLDAAGWEEAKRALLGPAPPKGPVEAVEVKPHPCRVPSYDQEVLCATYPVWENRETKQGRKIGLNIVILPALDKDKEKDPVFELSGGPGQAVTEDAGWLAQSPLRQKRDIVLVDQRGTGRSNPLRCSFYGEPVDVRLAAGDLFPVEAVRKCRAELEKVADLAQYTTAAFTDDLDEVRQWLGYERINLKGGSYGTDAAQVYWRRHAKTVRSVVLAGVANPKSLNPLGHAAAGQRALDLLVAECAAQPECKAAFPDPHADLKALKERIEKGATVTVLNTRTGERQEVRPSWGLLAEGIRGLLYGPVAGSVPLQIRKAAAGDLAPLVQASIERRLGLMEGLYWGLTFSVTCAEDLPFITEEMIRQKTAGTYLGDYRIRQQKAVCAVWPRGKATEDDHELVRSDLPALLVSGERDPVTPPESAEEAARYMTNGVHVVVKRGSHGGNNECVDGLIREFVDRPLGKKLDTSCAEKVYGPVKFMVP
jgi:pimeloyl-ACP methyl ester carboxylesterase